MPKASLFPRAADPKIRILCHHLPTAGLCPKTLHLDLVIPRGFDPGPPSSQFWKRERYTAELPGKGSLFECLAKKINLEELDCIGCVIPAQKCKVNSVANSCDISQNARFFGVPCDIFFQILICKNRKIATFFGSLCSNLRFLRKILAIFCSEYLATLIK